MLFCRKPFSVSRSAIPLSRCSCTLRPVNCSLRHESYDLRQASKSLRPERLEKSTDSNYVHKVIYAPIPRPYSHPGNIKSEWILTLGKLHAPAQFGKLFQCGLTAEPTPTAILHAAKGNLRLIMNRLIVYMNYS